MAESKFTQDVRLYNQICELLDIKTVPIISPK